MPSAHDPRSSRDKILRVVTEVAFSAAATEHGIAITPGGPSLTWTEMLAGCGSWPADSAQAARRLETLVRLRRAFGGPASQKSSRQLLARLWTGARLLALPPGHVDDWGARQAPGGPRGGALVLRLGWLDGTGEPAGTGTAQTVTDLLPLPPGFLPGLGLTDPAITRRLWHAAARRAVRDSAAAAAGLTAANRAGHRTLTPVAGTDVLTLLAMAPLRRVLAAGDGTGMRAVGVPQRSAGWYDLSLIDPDYVPLAFELSAPAERGLAVPVLVTRDEVVASRSTSASTS